MRHGDDEHLGSISTEGKGGAAGEVDDDEKPAMVGH